MDKGKAAAPHLRDWGRLVDRIFHSLSTYQGRLPISTKIVAGDKTLSRQLSCLRQNIKYSGSKSFILRIQMFRHHYYPLYSLSVQNLYGA